MCACAVSGKKIAVGKFDGQEKSPDTVKVLDATQRKHDSNSTEQSPHQLMVMSLNSSVQQYEETGTALFLRIICGR